MAVILYTATCSNCHNRKEANLIRRFADSISAQYIMRRTDYALDFAVEARNRSTLLPPFVYNEDTGKSVSFTGLTEANLQQML